MAACTVTLRNVEHNVAVVATAGIGAHFAAELFEAGTDVILDV
jgi:NADP-dependent 3-hydroxy acid dehydrogenase YdfG